MRISDWSSDVCSSDLTRRRPGISRAISTAKKPKVMVAIVTAIDGKPKPSGAVGGLGMSTTAPSSAVSTRPTASAASQGAAASQRLRHSSQATVSTERKDTGEGKRGGVSGDYGG